MESYVEVFVKGWRASELEELIFSHVILIPKQIPSARIISRNGWRICPIEYKHPGLLSMKLSYDWGIFVCLLDSYFEPSLIRVGASALQI